MGWSLGYDDTWKRDIGYGVPARCDHPGCNAKIHRGLAFVCGGEPYGGEEGCGLFFCREHLTFGEEHQVCELCAAGEPPHAATPDDPEWIEWKLTDESWAEWREAFPDEVAKMREALSSPAPSTHGRA